VPSGGSRHTVSHSRKISTHGSNFPKNRLFRVQKGTLFVCRLRVTGNVLQRRNSFHPLVDIPQIYSSWVTFAEGCTVFQLSTSELLRILCHGISNGDLFQTYARRRCDRIDDLHWYTPPVHSFWLGLSVWGSATTTVISLIILHEVILNHSLIKISMKLNLN